MRACLILALGLIALPAQARAQDGPRAEEAQEAPIVITGVRVDEFRDRLAACLARNCPPNEDADATLALAEALFLNAEYGEARRQVQASLERNRREAGGYPEPVSDLYRAHARLSRHLGFDAAALRSAHGILGALREGLPQEDHRHFTARLELAEAQMMAGRLPGALRELDRLEASARRAGRDDVVMIAELRALWYRHIADANGPARGQLIEMSRSTDPAKRMRAIGAKVMLSRIYRLEGDHDRADAMLAGLTGGSSTQRRLLYAPAYMLQAQEVAETGAGVFEDAIPSGNVLSRLPDNFEDKWIDVGFWVTPEGRVSDLEVLRRGGNAGWARPVLRSIEGRRYSTADESTYRLERYTYTAGYERAEATTGSHIRRRSPRARIEYFDLTANSPPPPTPPARD